MKIKKCKICQRDFTPYKSTDKVCSYLCSVKLAEQVEIEKKFKVLKMNVQLENSKERLQDLINKIVRLIDRGHPCISSGTPYGKYLVDAGHFYSVGSNPTLRYNLLNIFAQSRSDNDRKGGKGSNYGLSLKETFGADVRDEIESLPAKYKSIHLTNEEANEACKKARQMIKALESIDTVLSTDNRILLRKKLNEDLGIYK